MFSLKTRAGRDTCQPGQWKRFSISRKIFCIEENVSPLFLVLLAKMIGTWGFVLVANVDFQDWNSFLVSKDAHQLLDVLYMNRHFSFVYMQCFVWGLASSTHPMNMSHFWNFPRVELHSSRLNSWNSSSFSSKLNFLQNSANNLLLINHGAKIESDSFADKIRKANHLRTFQKCVWYLGQWKLMIFLSCDVYR